MDMDIIKGMYRGWILEPLNKGWSEDDKYLLKREDEIRTLRISTRKSLEDQKSEFEAVTSIPVEKGIIKPLSYGVMGNGKTFILYTFELGEDLRPILSRMTETKQYDLGLQAGIFLRAIHSVNDHSRGSKSRAEAYSIKIDRKISKYRKHQVNFPGLDKAAQFIDGHRSLLIGRPSVLLHGDYHVGNMAVDGDELKILDFNRYSFGDPYEEFDRMSMNIKLSKPFSKGLLHAYFQGVPPLEFFALWKLYALTNAVGSIPWALEYSPESLPFVEEMVEHTLSEFLVDDSPIPRWYRATSDIIY